MKKCIRIVAFAFLMCAILFSPASASQPDEVPAEVHAAAVEGFETFKSRAANDPENYNFANKEEALNATLGEGHRVYYMDNTKLEHGKPDSILSMTKTVNVWRFIILGGTAPKSSMMVAPVNGTYKMVEFGGDGQELGMALSNFKKLQTEKGIKGKPTLIQSGPTFYLVGKGADKEWVIPAVSKARADWAGGMYYENMYTSEQVVNDLKAKQKENSKAPEKSHGGAPTGTPTPPPTEQAAAPLTATTEGAKANEGPSYVIWGVGLVGALVLTTLFLRKRTAQK